MGSFRVGIYCTGVGIRRVIGFFTGFRGDFIGSLGFRWDF